MKITVPRQDLLEAVKSSDEVKIANADGSLEFTARLDLSERDRAILLSGGRLSYTREQANG